MIIGLQSLKEMRECVTERRAASAAAEISTSKCTCSSKRCGGAARPTNETIFSGFSPFCQPWQGDKERLSSSPRLREEAKVDVGVFLLFAFCQETDQNHRQNAFDIFSSPSQRGIFFPGAKKAEIFFGPPTSKWPFFRGKNPRRMCF